MNHSEETVFEIILYGGNARSFAMEAISCAKEGDMATARRKVEQAAREIEKAHHIQTSLIQQEAGGKKQTVTLLLVHAQDHLMNAMTVKDLAEEFIDLYQKMEVLGGVPSCQE